MKYLYTRNKTGSKNAFVAREIAHNQLFDWKAGVEHSLTWWSTIFTIAHRLYHASLPDEVQTPLKTFDLGLDLKEVGGGRRD